MHHLYTMHKPCMGSEIMNDAELITKIGTNKLAKHLDIAPSRVAGWKKRGIPFRWRVEIVEHKSNLVDNPKAFMRGEGRP